MRTASGQSVEHLNAIQLEWVFYLTIFSATSLSTRVTIPIDENSPVRISSASTSTSSLSSLHSADPSKSRAPKPVNLSRSVSSSASSLVDRSNIPSAGLPERNGQ